MGGSAAAGNGRSTGGGSAAADNGRSTGGGSAAADNGRSTGGGSAAAGSGRSTGGAAMIEIQELHPRSSASTTDTTNLCISNNVEFNDGSSSIDRAIDWSQIEIAPANEDEIDVPVAEEKLCLMLGISDKSGHQRAIAGEAIEASIADTNFHPYVHEYYSVSMFWAAYAGEIEPITDKSQWPQVTLDFDVVPPISKRPIGRQRKLRIKGCLEDGGGSSKGKKKLDGTGKEQEDGDEEKAQENCVKAKEKEKK